VRAGNTARFTARGMGTGPLTLQWQCLYSTGGVWTDLAYSETCLGVNSETLVLPEVATGMNHNLYRLRVTGACAPAVTSSPAQLTVTTR